MKDIYEFHVLTGIANPAAHKIDLLRSWCYPTDVFIKSKQYETIDECVKDAVDFVNAQRTEEDEDFALIECNPHLTGIADCDLSRWQNGEMMKVLLTNSEVESDKHPIICSILKLVASTGFEVAGNETSN